VHSGSDLHSQIATALIWLVKQIKALRYYPPNHPALRTAAEESLRGFQPLLAQSRHLSLSVRKDGFLLGDQPVAGSLQVLGQLATFCFARRIQSLTVLPDLSAADLHRFVHSLTLTPQEIHAQGGMPAILERARVTTIWVNELDLATILERKKRLEELPPESADATIESEQPPSHLSAAQLQALELEKLLKLLEQAQDDQRFRRLLQELMPLLRLNLLPENRWLVLRAMTLLCRNATAQKGSEVRRAHALNAIGQLLTDEMTDYLAASLTCSEGTAQTRKLLSNVLAFQGDKVVRRLMKLLAEEDAVAGRRLLAEVLVRIGAAAVPVLQEHLFDERWYVVRNAVSIIGRIRSQESLVHLTPLLEHQDIRVRRETIRALARIGSQGAVEILLQAAEADDQELRRQALLSLGAIRAAGAIPTLLKLLEQPNWNRKSFDIKKDAIRALGEIGATEAVPKLAALLGKRRLLRRARHDELRAAAAAALGEIGEESARPALEKATDDRAASVARAAAQALLQLQKDVS
jgi:HEAT repeat protein